MQPQFGLDQQPRQRQMGRRSGRFRKQPPDAYRYVQKPLLRMTPVIVTWLSVTVSFELNTVTVKGARMHGVGL